MGFTNDNIQTMRSQAVEGVGDLLHLMKLCQKT